MSERTQKPGSAPPTDDPILEAILRELEGIRFGQVTVTIQDGHVVQIERVERRRLQDSRKSTP
ncbi:MAG TPA: YezD family protein [Caulifigura sp.]|nr:YezD family protein [Caulifigura sp.]